MDVDLSTDLAALLPLVAPLLSGHSDVAIGTASPAARGSCAARSASSSRAATTCSCARPLRRAVLRRAVRLQGDPRRPRPRAAAARRGHRLVLRHRAARARRAAGLRIHEVPVDWVDDPDSRVDIVATALADLRGIARLGARPGDRRDPPCAALPRARAPRTSVPRRASPRQVLRFAAIGVASARSPTSLLYLAAPRRRCGAQGANALALLLTAIANTAANRRFTFGVRGRGGRGAAPGAGARRVRARPRP